MKSKKNIENRSSAERALKEALDGCKPNLEPLLSSIPDLIAQAASRRAQPPAWQAAIVPLALRAVPRLATAAALLVATSVGLHLLAGEQDSEVEPTQALTQSPTGSLNDLVLDSSTLDSDSLIQAVLASEGSS